LLVNGEWKKAIGSIFAIYSYNVSLLFLLFVG